MDPRLSEAIANKDLPRIKSILNTSSSEDLEDMIGLCNYVYNAVLTGDHEIVRYLLLEEYFCCDYTAVKFCVENKDTEMLEIFREEEEEKQEYSYCSAAVASGDMEIFVNLLDNKFRFDKYVIYALVDFDRIEIIKWIFENEILESEEDIFTYALRRKKYNIVQYIHDLQADEFVWKENCAYCSVNWLRKDCKEYFHSYAMIYLLDDENSVTNEREFLIKIESDDLNYIEWIPNEIIEEIIDLVYIQ